MNLAEYEQLQPNLFYTTSDGLEITFLTPNQHCAWRVQTLNTKEPDTIAWLATMTKDDLLWDVGANMGQYGLIAAKRGVRVHAFEPESQNFALLCRNIGVNNLGGTITAWPLAFSDKSGIDSFWVQSLQVGGSCSSYGESVNYHLQPKQYAICQGAAATTGDEFGFLNGYPTHIKIDVDGLEHKVVAGMDHVLDNVTSVLVEINTALPQHMEIYGVMELHGLLPDVETANKARRTEGSFAGIGNVIFTRKSQ